MALVPMNTKRNLKRTKNNNEYGKALLSFLVDLRCYLLGLPCLH